MSFEISSKKKGKNQIGNGSGINEISSASLMTNKSQTNRAGLRVYKIVILGELLKLKKITNKVVNFVLPSRGWRCWQVG